MNAWAARRKRIILLIVLSALIIIIGVPGYFLYNRTPTCFDNKQNGSETGVDCGGSCVRLCVPDILPLLSQGDARVLTVASSTYEVVAVYKNPNPSASVYRANYTISLYDQYRESPIKVIQGSTYIPKGSKFAIFVGPFYYSSSTPVAATLEWDPNILWIKDTTPVIDIGTLDTTLSGTDQPKLESSARNNSIEDAKNVEFTAVLYDDSGNIIASSKTYLESIAGGSTERIIFSWPQAFSTKPASISIIPRSYPDSSFLK